MDWPVQILAEIARAVYWFNPLFWLVCRWLRSESEHACDDVVLRTGVDAQDYAAHLLDLARTMKNSNRAWTPVLAMSRPPHLERRFVAMLNSSLNRRSVTPAKMCAITAVAILVTLPLANMGASPQEKLAIPVLGIVAPIVAPVEAAPPPVAPPAAVKSSPAPKPAPVAEPQGLADGRLFGTVMDGSGAVVPGVAVTVDVFDPVQVISKNAAGGVQLNLGNPPVAKVVTNEVGRFDFAALVPGLYSIKAELPGFATYHGPRIEIKSSQSVYQNIFMSVGNIVQRVEVSAAGTPRPPAPPVLPQRIRVGGNVMAAKLISQVKPVYPQTAQEAGVEGIVHLQGIIGPDGTFITLRVVSSSGADLARAALEAVRQWRYQPTMLNGEPIEVQTEVEVDFKLSQ
jgi:TonB family protein